MRVLLFYIGLILTASCSNRDNGQDNERTNNSRLLGDIKFITADFDSLTLMQLIVNNDKLLDIFKIELHDKQRSKKINAIIRSDSNRLKVYNTSKFKIKGDKRCNGYRHLYVTKERRIPVLDLDPYYALFLVIIDPSSKTTLTMKLEEKSNSMRMITSATDLSNWKLSQDSLLTIYSKSHWCSDIEIEG